jgi:serine phosphatase RsbU (regulator of sigma subunit)
MTKRARILLGGLLLALMSAYFCAYVYSISLPKKGSYAGFTATWDGKGEPRIASVAPTALVADFQVGDELIAVDGVRIKDDPRVLVDNDQPPGTRVTLTIRRAGQLRDVTFQTIPHRERVRFDPMNYVSLLFLLTGWIVFLLRSDDKQSWLLALMLGTLTVIGSGPDNLPSWSNLIVGVAGAVGLLFLPIFVHFFLIFPEPSPLLRRFARLETWVYLPYLLIILPAAVFVQFIGDFMAWTLRFQWLQYFPIAANFLIATYLAAGLASLIINYRAASPIARRRLHVVMAGSGAGFFNLFLVVMGGPTGLQPRIPTLWSWFSTTLFVTLPLVPLSFVYAIVRHKVIPVSLIIRRGLRYLLVKRGSILLVMAGVGVALYFALDAFFDFLNPSSGRVIGVISAVIAIIVWQLARAFHLRVVAPKIDRWFFHQAYDAQQIIAELAESLRLTTSLPKLLELVATKIQSALHAANVAILLRDEASDDYLCAYFCVYSFHNRSAMPSPCAVRLPRDSAVIARLAETGQPIDLDGRDPQFHPHSENGGANALSVEEREALQKLESSLLLPIAGKEGLLGVISLGPHMGDLPFTSEDKKLLLSVSGPASFALENARLIERAIEDARRRQELEAENEQRARELEEARQLQLSMLPKEIPQLPHLEIAAYMKPATEVGGDYYDFHLSDDGTLTVAVGDATGHGLKAGTVVTAIKSLFNHLAQEPNIPAIFQKSSRALKLMNLRSLFMAMAMIKVKGYRLTLSSAGMPPVLIYRAEQKKVEEISLRGIPLGSLTAYSYRERDLDLAPGDVVVMMSDGFPERFNGRNEMLNYESARRILSEVSTLAPQEIIDIFIKIGDTWAAGRPQDDDVTFVVLKVKAAEDGFNARQRQT